MQEDFSHASEDAGGAAERGGAMAGGVSDILVEDILERLECDVMCATATQSLARAPHFTPLYSTLLPFTTRSYITSPHTPFLF